MKNLSSFQSGLVATLPTDVGLYGSTIDMPAFRRLKTAEATALA
jgi:hypothetical protein